MAYFLLWSGEKFGCSNSSEFLETSVHWNMYPFRQKDFSQYLLKVIRTKNPFFYRECPKRLIKNLIFDFHVQTGFLIGILLDIWSLLDHKMKKISRTSSGRSVCSLFLECFRNINSENLYQFSTVLLVIFVDSYLDKNISHFTGIKINTIYKKEKKKKRTQKGIM